MMFVLPLNVRDGVIHLRNPNTECAISFLPGEFSIPRKSVLHPLGRAALDQLQRLGDRHRRRERQQKMDVILHSPDGHGLYFVFFCDPSHERPEAFLRFQVDGRFALFGAEYAMVQAVAEGMSHGGFLSDEGGTVQSSLRDSSIRRAEVCVRGSFFPALKCWASVNCSSGAFGTPRL